MKITQEEYDLFQDLVTEFFSVHPQLYEVHFDENGRMYENFEGFRAYDTYGPTTKRKIDQLSEKLKSLL